MRLPPGWLPPGTPPHHVSGGILPQICCSPLVPSQGRPGSSWAPLSPPTVLYHQSLLGPPPPRPWSTLPALARHLSQPRPYALGLLSNLQSSPHSGHGSPVRSGQSQFFHLIDRPCPLCSLAAAPAPRPRTPHWMSYLVIPSLGNLRAPSLRKPLQAPFPGWSEHLLWAPIAAGVPPPGLDPCAHASCPHPGALTTLGHLPEV